MVPGILDSDALGEALQAACLDVVLQLRVHVSNVHDPGTDGIIDGRVRACKEGVHGKEDYLLAMERSPIKDIEIKHILKAALTDDINSREVYMKGIDHSYYYEGYTTFKTEEL